MITSSLLQRYFDGSCNVQEQQQVEQWLLDDTSDHTVLKNLMQKQLEEETGLQSMENAHAAAMKKDLLQDLRQQLYPQQKQDSRSAAVLVSIPFYKRAFFKAAVAITAVFLLGLWYWNIQLHHKAANQSIASVHWDTLINTGIRNQKATLPDGTQVWLHTGSRLAYQIGNTYPQRKVQLEGQAFFDVAHDAHHPFIVQAGTMETTVLGTAFNVESYPAENEISVSLVRGKVALQYTASQKDAMPLATLQAGEMYTWSKNTSTGEKKKLTISDWTSWTQDRMVFNDVPVKVALQRLAIQYGYTIHYNKEVQLDTYRFSTIFHEETPAQMVQNILFITGYNYRLTGKELYIFQ